MRSEQLRQALNDFVDQAAARLQADVDAGIEVPFELARSGARSGRSALYSYQPLTGRFIRERWPVLRNLDSYPRAAEQISYEHGIGRYLTSRGVDRLPTTAARTAECVLAALLEEIFREQSSFEVHPQRLQSALQTLQTITAADGVRTTIIGALSGVTLISSELPLTRGLSLVRAEQIEGQLPEQIMDGKATQLLVTFTVEHQDERQAVRDGREVLCELLRAMRLFGDGRVTLGQVGFARVGDGGWRAIPLGSGGRPHGMLIISPEQEDELRAFCNLISRRSPQDNELAWALRRFEIGCDRDREHDGLSDYLLALRALLEPEGPASGLLAARISALCAPPERRHALAERVRRAIALERAVIAGTAVASGQSEDLVRSLSDHLRALLRDVICGHLDSDLVGLADELIDQMQAPSDDPLRSLAEPGVADELPPLEQETLWEQPAAAYAAGR